MAKGYRLRELKIEVNKECPFGCLDCSSNSALQAAEKLDLSKVTHLVREFADAGAETLAISGSSEPLVYKELTLIPNVCRTMDVLITPMTFLNGSE